jgi:hypothetical protein
MPCGCCGHAAEKHNIHNYCRECSCTNLMPQPTCQCKDGWNWMCKFHGMND